MKRSELVTKINGNKDIDFGIYEREVWFMGMRTIGISFYLRNGNRNDTIKNPYKEAIKLTKGNSVYDVTIVEFEECNAFSYFWEDNGIPRFGSEDFRKMAKGNEELIGKKITDLFFTILPLDEKQLMDLGKIESFEELIEYIRYQPYLNPIRIKGEMGWDNEYYDGIDIESISREYKTKIINAGWVVA